MRLLALLTVSAAALAAAACQSPEAAERAAQNQAELDRLIAVRQGPEVDRICFSGQINSWSELSRDSILLRRGVNDWYKVDLNGTCNPQWAFNSIALASRPSGTSCITPGDRITTDEPEIGGVCLIDAIYEWDEDAEVAEMASSMPDAP